MLHWALGTLPLEGWAGFGWMTRGCRQHSNEVTAVTKEGEQDCEGEGCILLAFRALGKKLGRLKLEEIWDLSEEGLEHPTEQLGLFYLHTWEPLKLPE